MDSQALLFNLVGPMAGRGGLRPLGSARPPLRPGARTPQLLESTLAGSRDGGRVSEGALRAGSEAPFLRCRERPRGRRRRG
jgi:hypothetical protein